MDGWLPCGQRLTLVLCLCFSTQVASAQLKVDEQKQIRWHRPQEIRQLFAGPGPAPVTVAVEDPQTPDSYLSLDSAIQQALQYSEVIRVLTGVSATATGSTIYDTAIATTPIDEAVGRFDPVFFANNNYRKTETPFAAPTAVPLLAQILDAQVSGNVASAGVRKTNRSGGIGEFSFNHDWMRTGRDGDPVFNPSERPSMELSYTQPLLAGGGRAANQAPIVIARLDLDRSYFQYKDNVQQLVSSVITAYWALVASRTNLWAREQQEFLLKVSEERADARLRAGQGNLSEYAQAKVAYANIRASLIAAQADVLQREAALRNVLGLPPEDGVRLVPSTPPTRDRMEFNWQQLFNTAQVQRPDLVELSLILQADQQRLVQSRNLARPSLDATALHRWNGLRGTIVTDNSIASSPADHTDWSLGITFSVPAGLRAARAQMRSVELLIARDRANIRQGLHATRHDIATSLRNLESDFLQYKAFQEARLAAYENIDVQIESARVGTVEYIVFLQAVSDWGNAVSAEAASLAQYNSDLAALETETGTILETHGVFFVEERFASIGPFGRKHKPHCYPRDLRSVRSQLRYPDAVEPAENSFELENFREEFEELDPLDLTPRSSPMPDFSEPVPQETPEFDSPPSALPGRSSRRSPGPLRRPQSRQATNVRRNQPSRLFQLQSLDRIFR